jgi:hypothetical protein
MIVTKIYTETVNYNAMMDVCEVLFPGGYTVYDGIGSYEGRREGAFILEVWDAENIMVQAFAHWCMHVNGQKQVDVFSYIADHYDVKWNRVTHE